MPFTDNIIQSVVESWVQHSQCNGNWVSSEQRKKFLIAAKRSELLLQNHTVILQVKILHKSHDWTWMNKLTAEKLIESEIWIKFSFATDASLNSVSTCCISVYQQQSICHNVDSVSVSDFVPRLDDLPGDPLLESGGQQQSQCAVHQHLQPPQLLPGAVCSYTTWLLFRVPCCCLEKCWNHSHTEIWFSSFWNWQ